MAGERSGGPSIGARGGAAIGGERSVRVSVATRPAAISTILADRPFSAPISINKNVLANTMPKIPSRMPDDPGGAFRPFSLKNSSEFKVIKPQRKTTASDLAQAIPMIALPKSDLGGEQRSINAGKQPEFRLGVDPRALQSVSVIDLSEKQVGTAKPAPQGEGAPQPARTPERTIGKTELRSSAKQLGRNVEAPAERIKQTIQLAKNAQPSAVDAAIAETRKAEKRINEIQQELKIIDIASRLQSRRSARVDKPSSQGQADILPFPSTSKYDEEELTAARRKRQDTLNKTDPLAVAPKVELDEEKKKKIERLVAAGGLAHAREAMQREGIKVSIDQILQMPIIAAVKPATKPDSTPVVTTVRKRDSAPAGAPSEASRVSTQTNVVRRLHVAQELPQQAKEDESSDEKDRLRFIVDKSAQEARKQLALNAIARRRASQLVFGDLQNDSSPGHEIARNMASSITSRHISEIVKSTPAQKDGSLEELIASVGQMPEARLEDIEKVNKATPPVATGKNGESVGQKDVLRVILGIDEETLAQKRAA